jgi:hypothetical protein
MQLEHEPIYRVNEDCDLQRLYRIAIATNEYVGRGEECVVCLGHSGDDPDQLSVSAGQATNFVVAGDVLYADLEIDDIWADQRELKSRRKKSVELWADDILSSVSLLCKNRPALELSVIKYQSPIRDSEKETLHYDEGSAEETQEPVKEVENMSPAEIQQLFIETLEHSEFKCKFDDIVTNIVPKLQETVKKMEDTLAPLLAEELEEEVEGEENALEGEIASPEGEGTEEVEGDKGEAISAVEEVEAEHDAGKAEETVAAVEKEEVEKNDMASASANDTYIPDIGDKKKKDKEDVVKKYQMETLTALKEKEEVVNKYDEMVKKYQCEVRKNVFNVLCFLCGKECIVLPLKTVLCYYCG